jgi:alpha-L-arabinofuranosidase
MQGTSLDVHVDSDSYDGTTVPTFVQHLEKTTPPSSKLTKYIDVSAVLSTSGQEVRVAIVNRHETAEYDLPILFGPSGKIAGDKVKVYEVWSESLKDTNGFDGETVKTVEKEVEWEGKYPLKAHSFQGEFVYSISVQ